MFLVMPFNCSQKRLWWDGFSVSLGFGYREESNRVVVESRKSGSRTFEAYNSAEPDSRWVAPGSNKVGRLPAPPSRSPQTSGRSRKGDMSSIEEAPLLINDSYREGLEALLQRTGTAAREALAKIRRRRSPSTIEDTPEVCTCTEHIISPEVFGGSKDPHRRQVLSHFATAFLLDSRTWLETETGAASVETARRVFADPATSHSWLSRALGISDAWVDRKARSAWVVSSGKHPRHLALVEERRSAAGPLAAAFKSGGESLFGGTLPGELPPVKSSHGETWLKKCEACGHVGARHLSTGCLGKWPDRTECCCREFPADSNRGRELLFQFGDAEALKCFLQSAVKREDPRDAAEVLKHYVLRVPKDLRDADLIKEADIIRNAGKSAKKGRPLDPDLQRRWKKIREVAARGVIGKRYCEILDVEGLPTPPRWQNEGCPKTYAEAYKLPKWRVRITDEKNKATHRALLAKTRA